MPIKYTVEEDDQEKVAAENKAARIQTDDELAVNLGIKKTATGALYPTGVTLDRTMRQNDADTPEESIAGVKVSATSKTEAEIRAEYQRQSDARGK